MSIKSNGEALAETKLAIMELDKLKRKLESRQEIVEGFLAGRTVLKRDIIPLTRPKTEMERKWNMTPKPRWQWEHTEYKLAPIEVKFSELQAEIARCSLSEHTGRHNSLAILQWTIDNPNEYAKEIAKLKNQIQPFDEVSK